MASEPFAGARVRRVLHALLAIAAVDVAAALLVLSSTWNDYRGEHGELAVFLTTLFLGHVATACVLLLAGRGDQRAWLLGGFFLLKANFQKAVQAAPRSSRAYLAAFCEAGHTRVRSGV